MKIRFLLAYVGVAMLALFTSCSISSGLGGGKVKSVTLAWENMRVSEHFSNLDKEIALTVKSNVQSEDMVDYGDMHEKMRLFLPKYSFTPSVDEFSKSVTGTYMRKMGFDISSDGPYRLVIDVKRFCISWDLKTSGVFMTDKNASIMANVMLSYKLVNDAGETMIPMTNVNVAKVLEKDDDPGLGMGMVYGMALAKIDWERIAEYLKVARQAKDEKNAQVTGEGDTALEGTVIRWFITSTPQGADVSWRVISSTPDVKNTNSNYVGTTPYETTENFDIKGLTYNNSGNVQIEITCERPGYLPQKKRFNVRQAIDQKEISAKFNLVKDE